MTSLYSSQATHLSICCLYTSFLSLSLTRESLQYHVSFLPSLPEFFCWRIWSSCTLRKACLKSYCLCSTPLSLRTSSQAISLSNPLNSLKFSLLKFRILTLLFDSTILKITNSTTNSTAQSVSNLHLFNELLCIGEY